jgi:hypothetical protein
MPTIDGFQLHDAKLIEQELTLVQKPLTFPGKTLHGFELDDPLNGTFGNDSF